MICPKCMVSSPVGQRCRECARGPRVAAYEVPWFIYLVTVPVALGAGLVAGWIGGSIGFFVFFVAPAIGGFVGQVVSFVANRKRGPGLAFVAAGGVIVGALLSPLLSLLSSPASAFDLPRLVLAALLNPFLILYAILAASAAYWRLR
ncbi:MAG: hypothetical protein HY318_03365 [Armatimonadetes bacterium]|nr:hypothetical protein [Armatimonadota bacterium]